MTRKILLKKHDLDLKFEVMDIIFFLMAHNNHTPEVIRNQVVFDAWTTVYNNMQ